MQTGERAAGARLDRADPTWLRTLPWLACALGVAPLCAGGFPAGHDWLYELVRVAEYRAALAAGQLPPYWSENLYGGYGSPVFLYYAPLFSALATAGAAALGSVAAGSVAALMLASGIALYAMQGLLAELLGSAGAGERAAARVGAVFYALHPYLLGDKLVRNADAEFLALCLAPLPLWGVALAARRPRAGFALVSAGLAAVVLAHNLTALVAVPLLLGAGLALHGVRARRTWTELLAGVAAGLLLSAFFWLPALFSTEWIRPEELLRGKLDFRGQFQTPTKLFGHVRFFATGLATPLALAAGAWVAWRQPEPRRLLLALLGAACVAIFFALRPSQWLWERLPFLPFFQFPWRMMGPLALVTAPIAALALAASPRAASRRLELGLFAALVANALPILAQYRPFPDDLERLAPALVNPSLVRRGDQTVTLGDEYLPRAGDTEVWRVQRPIEGPVVAALGRARWRTLRDAGTQIELEVDADEPARLRLGRWMFPGWRLWLNGAEAELAASAWGTLEVPVPAGATRVALRLDPPPLRRFALALSGVALVAWLAAVLAPGRWYVPGR